MAFSYLDEYSEGCRDALTASEWKWGSEIGWNRNVELGEALNTSQMGSCKTVHI